MKYLSRFIKFQGGHEFPYLSPSRQFEALLRENCKVRFQIVSKLQFQARPDLIEPIDPISKVGLFRSKKWPVTITVAHLWREQQLHLSNHESYQSSYLPVVPPRIIWPCQMSRLKMKYWGLMHRTIKSHKKIGKLYTSFNLRIWRYYRMPMPYRWRFCFGYRCSVIMYCVARLFGFAVIDESQHALIL